MSVIEIAAASLGVVTVLLVVRRSMWNFPVALAMVSLYFVVFLDAKLYSDALLQIFFFVINLYGWWNWHRAPTDDDGVAVEAMDWPARLRWGGATAAVSLALGFAMARWTDAAAPFPDAAVAGMSIAAQLLQSLRRVESWLWWIAVDLLAVGLYASRGLTVTAALYEVFLGIAVAGLVAWRRHLA